MIETDIDMNQKNDLKNFLEKQMDTINYWLSFAEAKNGALLAINVAIMAVLVSIFNEAPIICVISLSCYIVSCGICLKSFYPNIKSRPEYMQSKNNAEINLLYYGDIATIGCTEKYLELCKKKYFSTIQNSLNNGYTYDLASEILINSRIVLEKYKCFKKAIKVDFIALYLTIIFFFVA